MDIIKLLDISKVFIAMISAVLSIILAFINFRKSKKKILEKDAEVCESNERTERAEKTLMHFKEVCNNACVRIDLIKSWIPEAIAEAEKESNVSGATKKTLAIAYIMQKCSENNVDYKVISKEVSEQIESLIELTKKVNFIDLEKMYEELKEENEDERVN